MPIDIARHGRNKTARRSGVASAIVEPQSQATATITIICQI